MMFKPRNFYLYELLPPQVYRNEEVGWHYLDEMLLRVLDVVRNEIIKAPMICNTWYQDGNRSQCGYRTQSSTVGVANSQHKLGKAVDLLCPKYSAEQMRQMIEEKKDLLPCSIRMERDVNWLHIDIKYPDYSHKITYFKG